MGRERGYSQNIGVLIVLVSFIKFIILEIKVVLISCSLSKVASKAVENNGVMALMSHHSAPCWAVPWREWAMSKQMMATTVKGSYRG